jgi:hypothetical protein
MRVRHFSKKKCRRGRAGVRHFFPERVALFLEVSHRSVAHFSLYRLRFLPFSRGCDTSKAKTPWANRARVRARKGE